MTPLAFFKQMIEAGVPQDVALSIAEKFESDQLAEQLAKLTARREKDAARKKAERVRNGHAESRGQAVTPEDSAGPSPHVRERDAQVVNPSSSLRSEGNPPVKPNGLTAPKGAETERGTRLPEGWTPDEDGWRYAAEALGPNINPARELDRFRDYWRAVPGAKGRKASWPATWRNWCRNAADRLPKPRLVHDRSTDDKLSRKQANLSRAFDASHRVAGYRGEP